MKETESGSDTVMWTFNQNIASWSLMAENLKPFTSKRKRTNDPDPARKKKTLLQSTAGSSRRSAITIIPYEPPTDVFTPPKEVFLTPMTNTMSKSSKRRKSVLASPSSFKSAKARRKNPPTLTIVTAVKQELPDHIDLTLPMPPPSPSDDPLLLSGPSEFDFLSEPTTPASVKQEEELLPSPIAVDNEEAIKMEEEFSHGIVRISASAPDPRSAASSAAFITQVNICPLHFGVF